MNDRNGKRKSKEGKNKNKRKGEEAARVGAGGALAMDNTMEGRGSALRTVRDVPSHPWPRRSRSQGLLRWTTQHDCFEVLYIIVFVNAWFLWLRFRQRLLFC